MFRSKRRQQIASEELQAVVQPPVCNVVVNTQENEYRPCYVNGRKALFHRWINSTPAQLPKGQEPNENSRYFQFRCTHGLVEFEDGTMDQVWPYAIKFADHGRFQDYTWDPAEEATHGSD